jgi:hypothetical protein
MKKSELRAIIREEIKALNEVKWVVIFGKKGEKPASAEYKDEKDAKDFKKSVEKDGINAMIVKR